MTALWIITCIHNLIKYNISVRIKSSRLMYSVYASIDFVSCVMYGRQNLKVHKAIVSLLIPSRPFSQVRTIWYEYVKDGCLHFCYSVEIINKTIMKYTYLLPMYSYHGYCYYAPYKISFYTRVRNCGMATRTYTRRIVKARWVYIIILLL